MTEIREDEDKPSLLAVNEERPSVHYSQSIFMYTLPIVNFPSIRRGTRDFCLRKRGENERKGEVSPLAQQQHIMRRLCWIHFLHIDNFNLSSKFSELLRLLLVSSSGARDKGPRARDSLLHHLPLVLETEQLDTHNFGRPQLKAVNALSGNDQDRGHLQTV